MTGLRWALLLLALTFGAEARAGEAFRDCAECPEMVAVPAGSFAMGSPPGEKGRTEAEGPVRQVTIARPFAIGKYEVTFAEWDACLRAGGCEHRPDDEGWGRGRRPVMNVSWQDAQAYLRWLSAKTGEDYRLPSEAEWEYAARAGTTGPFHFGRAISPELANYGGNAAHGPGAKGAWRERTAPVGSYPPNAFDLHDAHGNVSEWVQDCWNRSHAGAPSDGSARLDGDCSLRVLRGGSWYVKARFLRSAYRIWNAPDFRLRFLIGFRVARPLAP